MSTEKASPISSTQGQAGSTYVGFDSLTPFQQELQKKVPKVQYLLMILVLFSMLGGIANDAMVPAMGEVAHDFNTTIAEMQKIIPYFALGSGVGLFIWGPTIDRFGRKTIVMFCSVLALMTNYAIALVTDLDHMLAIRVFQGIIFAGISVVPSVVIRDVYTPRQFVIYNAWLITLFLFTPAFAPIIGGWVTSHLHWHWIFHGISILVLIAMYFYMVQIPETLDPEKRQSFNTIRIIKNYGSILINLSSLWLVTINAVFAILIFGFASLISAIALDDFKVAPEVLSYTFIPVVLAIIISVQVNQFFIRRGASPIKMWKIGTICMMLTTLVNVYVYFNPVNVWLVVGSVSLNLLFNGFQIGNSLIIYLMKYPHMTGTATSLINGMRLLIAGVVISHLANLPTNHGSTLVAIYAIAALLIGVLSIIYWIIWPTKIDK